MGTKSSLRFHLSVFVSIFIYVIIFLSLIPYIQLAGPYSIIFLFLLIIVPFLIAYYLFKRNKDMSKKKSWEIMDYKTGMKAGILALIIPNLISLLFSYQSYILNPFLLFFVPLATIVGGVVWGSIFQAYYNKLPGKNSIQKAFVLGLVPLSIGLIFNFSQVITPIPYLLNIIINYFVFSFSLGFLYEKFRKK